MPVHEIRVAPLEGDPDADEAIARGESMFGAGDELKGLATSTTYSVEGDFTAQQLEELAGRVANPVTDRFDIDNPADAHGSPLYLDRLTVPKWRFRRNIVFGLSEDIPA